MNKFLIKAFFLSFCSMNNPEAFGERLILNGWPPVSIYWWTHGAASGLLLLSASKSVGFPTLERIEFKAPIRMSFSAY